MLKNIPPILSPELLKILCEMGHSDYIVIADGNFPGTSIAKENNNQIIRLDGHGVPEVLDAILQVFPLDYAVEKPVNLMAVTKGLKADVSIWETYKKIVKKYEPERNNPFEQIERFDFYKKAKKAYAVVATGEKAKFANIILQKGVI